MNYEDFADWLDRTGETTLFLIVTKDEAPILAELLEGRANTRCIIQTSATANVRELAYKIIKKPKDGWTTAGVAYYVSDALERDWYRTIRFSDYLESLRFAELLFEED